MDGSFVASAADHSPSPDLVLLDRVYSYFREGVPVELATDTLVLGLRLLRTRLDHASWREFVGRALRHPLANIIHSDPFTRRAYEKPRGYAGDAYLIDFIYGGDCAPDEVKHLSGRGQAIYDYTRSAPASAAVRERRDIVARLVDAAAERDPQVRVLAIAGGHLREIQCSQAAAEGCIGEWVCLDQDAETIEFVKRTHQVSFVKPVRGSIRRLIAGPSALGSFDLIYASGLYDYLPDDAAVRLTATAAQMLRPGGAFIFGNFAPGIFDQGYMESFMGWELLFRSEKEMAMIMDRSASGPNFCRETFAGENKNIVYGVVTRQE